MSEELNPGAAVTPDVLENAEEVAVKTNEADEAEETAQMPNYAEMSLAELPIKSRGIFPSSSISPFWMADFILDAMSS